MLTVTSSGGLSPTGSSNGGCSSSTGQVYARAGIYDDYYMIMYSVSDIPGTTHKVLLPPRLPNYLLTMNPEVVHA